MASRNKNLKNLIAEGMYDDDIYYEEYGDEYGAEYGEEEEEVKKAI